jgi:copper chaperone CopZ
MNPDVKTALEEFKKDVQVELDKELKELTLELEVADVELIHGKITERGQ